MEVKFSQGTETILITTLTSHGRENSRRVKWLLHDDRLRMPHRFSRRQLLQVKPTHVANIGRNHSNDRDDETVKKKTVSTRKNHRTLHILDVVVRELQDLVLADVLELILALLCELVRDARLPPEQLDHPDDAHRYSNTSATAHTSVTEKA